MVAEDFSLKIIDLGLAQSITNGPVRVTAGTPGYMAPEVSEGPGDG
jgi:serine/threonine protein kinase